MNNSRISESLALCLLISLGTLSSCAYFTTTQENINQIIANFDNNAVTAADIEHMERFYDALILGGRILYPEAAGILHHYLHGDGSDLRITSEYFFESDFLQTYLEEMAGGRTGPIWLRISDDPRIAYAVNGFFIEWHDGIPVVTQYIEFDHAEGSGVYTTFPRPGGQLIVPDRLIRVFESAGGCRPFTVYISED